MAEDLSQTAIKMVASSMDTMKNWFMKTAEKDSLRETNSASNTPEIIHRIGQSLSDGAGRFQRGTLSLESFSPLLMMRNLSKSPLFKNRAKTYSTRSETRRRIFDCYHRHDDHPSASPPQSPSETSNQSSQQELCENKSFSCLVSTRFKHSDNSYDSIEIDTDYNKSLTDTGGRNKNEVTVAKDKRMSNYSNSYDDRVIANTDYNNKSGLESNQRKKNTVFKHKQSMLSQDSGIANCHRDSVNTITTDAYGSDENKSEIYDYSKSVLDYIDSDKTDRELWRDPYRVVRRPSRKSNPFSVSQFCFLNENNAVDCRDNVFPKLKISIQYFNSCRQLRISFTDVKNLELLYRTVSETTMHAKIRLMSKRRQKRSAKAKTARLNDVIYFHHVDAEKIQQAYLGICLYKNGRLWSKTKKIGEVHIPLENFDLTFETSVWCKIQNPKKNNEDSHGDFFQIIPFTD